MNPLAALAAGATAVAGPVAVMRALTDAGIDIPDRAVAAYITAADQAPCPIRWTLIAAVGHRETNHGRYGDRHLDPASGRIEPELTNWVGAAGPMQFIPSTWARHGRDGDHDGHVDVQDIDDAAAGAAAYLCSLNAHTDPTAALNAYNSGDPTGRAGGRETAAYTPAVLDYANQLDQAIANAAQEAAAAPAERSVLAAVDRGLVAAWETAGRAVCGPDTPTACHAWQRADHAAFSTGPAAVAPPPAPRRLDRPDRLDPTFGAALDQLIADAPGRITITSGWRSLEQQTELWEASDKTGRWVAPPGRSNHERGLAADLDYATPAVEAWAHTNAARYRLTFPMPWEPWHIEPQGAAS